MTLDSISDILLSPSIPSKYLWLSIDALPFLLQNNYRKPCDISSFFLSLTTFLLNQTKYQLIIVPSFTFDFGSSHIFNTVTSIPSVNSYSRYLFQVQYPHRSIHPFYSFYCFGTHAKEFCENNLFDSVGNNSIFSYY